YNHVRDKDELYALLVDHVFTAAPGIDPTKPWQQATTTFFKGLHKQLVRHPAAAQIAALMPIATPGVTRQGDEVLAVLRTGLTKRHADEAFTALSCYTLGAVLYTTARRGAARERYASGLEHLVKGFSGSR